MFSLHVDERPKRPVVFGASAGQGRPRAGRRPRESTRLRQRIGVSAIRM
ncbi:nitrilase [Burkholderia multivorans]|nr:nitrilase [Burkholderia multivorans]